MVVQAAEERSSWVGWVEKRGWGGVGREEGMGWVEKRGWGGGVRGGVKKRGWGG